MARPNFSLEQHQAFANHICETDVIQQVRDANYESTRQGITSDRAKQVVAVDQVLRPYPLTEAVEWIVKNLSPGDVWLELAGDSDAASDSHTEQPVDGDHPLSNGPPTQRRSEESVSRTGRATH